VVVEKDITPWNAGKHAIYAFQHWVMSFIAPCVETSTKVQLHELQLLQEALKHPQEAPVKAAIVFVICHVNEVEVATD
jgi:hypothetical protein